ncbi:hypothetical protein LXL04_034626 [Taraxacum kok-saghyz]
MVDLKSNDRPGSMEKSAPKVSRVPMRVPTLNKDRGERNIEQRQVSVAMLGENQKKREGSTVGWNRLGVGKKLIDGEQREKKNNDNNKRTWRIRPAMPVPSLFSGQAPAGQTRSWMKATMIVAQSIQLDSKVGESRYPINNDYLKNKSSNHNSADISININSMTPHLFQHLMHAISWMDDIALRRKVHSAAVRPSLRATALKNSNKLTRSLFDSSAVMPTSRKMTCGFDLKIPLRDDLLLRTRMFPGSSYHFGTNQKGNMDNYYGTEGVYDKSFLYHKRLKNITRSIFKRAWVPICARELLSLTCPSSSST